MRYIASELISNCTLNSLNICYLNYFQNQGKQCYIDHRRQNHLQKYTLNLIFIKFSILKSDILGGVLEQKPQLEAYG